MLILIYADKSIKWTMDEQLTLTDLLAVKQGLLTILRIIGNVIEKLLLDDKPRWLSVDQAELTYQYGKGFYHG